MNRCRVARSRRGVASMAEDIRACRRVPDDGAYFWAQPLRTRESPGYHRCLMAGPARTARTGKCWRAGRWGAGVPQGSAPRAIVQPSPAAFRLKVQHIQVIGVPLTLTGPEHANHAVVITGVQPGNAHTLGRSALPVRRAWVPRTWGHLQARGERLLRRRSIVTRGRP